VSRARVRRQRRHVTWLGSVLVRGFRSGSAPFQRVVLSQHTGIHNTPGSSGWDRHRSNGSCVWACDAPSACGSTPSRRPPTGRRRAGAWAQRPVALRWLALGNDAYKHTSLHSAGTIDLGSSLRSRARPKKGLGSVDLTCGLSDNIGTNMEHVPYFLLN
jgi:hypothetical protein